MTATLIRCDWCARDAGGNPIIGRHGVYCSRICEARDAAETAAEARAPRCADCKDRCAPSADRAPVCDRCEIERHGREVL